MFWFDHDATITWEIQPKGIPNFGYYDHSDFGTPIFNFEDTETYGSFSALSNRIHINRATYAGDAFDGMCK